MERILAAGTPLGKIGGTGEGLGPFAKTTTSPAATITTAVSGIIGILTVAGAIWFLFQFTIGGLTWISSAGDKAKITESRERLTNAFIGLLVVVAGWAILALMGQFLGWKEILVPASVLDKLKFQ